MRALRACAACVRFVGGWPPAVLCCSPSELRWLARMRAHITPVCTRQSQHTRKEEGAALAAAAWLCCGWSPGGGSMGPSRRVILCVQSFSVPQYVSLGILIAGSFSVGMQSRSGLWLGKR